MTNEQTEDKKPTPDPAEDNAFFPSPYSLKQFTSPKTDLSDAVTLPKNWAIPN